MSMLGALCLLAVGTPLITVEGNKVLTDDVYRSVLALGPVVTASTSTTAPPTLAWVPLLESDPEAAARVIREQVQDFLLSSGYDLARVEVEATPAQVTLHVDEGQLDKVIFLREGTLANVELRFALHLPSEIFNRPLLERKLKKLAEDTNITRAYYELVPTRPVEHRGIQVEEPTLIRGLRLLNPGSHHELRIRLERDVPRAGLSLGLGFSGSDGFYGKVGYRAGDLLFRRDRLDTEARVAFYLGDEIQSDRNPFGISHVQGKVRWSPVPLGSDAVRSYLAVDFDLFGRRRNDLCRDSSGGRLGRRRNHWRQVEICLYDPPARPAAGNGLQRKTFGCGNAPRQRRGADRTLAGFLGCSRCSPGERVCAGCHSCRYRGNRSIRLRNRLWIGRLL